MKTILLSFALLFTVAIFAQDVPVPEPQKVSASTVYKDGKEAVKTVYTDAKALSPKIEAGIESLSKSLKTTADKLWDILVRQQLVYSLVFLVLTLASILNWIVFYRRNFKTKTEKDFVRGIKTNVEAEKNPNYSSYASSNDPRSKLYIDKPLSTEEILIPIEHSTISWFKYVHLLICLTFSFLSFWHFSDMMTGFINPEYGALKTIIEATKQLK